MIIEKIEPGILPAGPVEIGRAYGDLTKKSFAAWILICSLPRKDLTQGVRHMANALGYKTPRQADPVIKELKSKGYISFVYEVGRRGEFLILHRPTGLSK